MECNGTFEIFKSGRIGPDRTKQSIGRSRKSLQLLSLIWIVLLSSTITKTAFAECHEDALGISRTIVIDAKPFRSYSGTEESLGLQDKEVILTFDDGPSAKNTSNILRALADECVKATFFIVGKRAQAHPSIVRDVARNGHTIGHHTHGHNRLPDLPIDQASVLIDRGVRKLQKIAYANSAEKNALPFFRYPYLARTKSTDKMLAKKGLISFMANIDSHDWKLDSSAEIHDRILRLLEEQKKGIVLMHDIHHGTANMLPQLLRSLKAGGYKVAHVIAKTNLIFTEKLTRPTTRPEKIVKAKLYTDEPQEFLAIPTLSGRQLSMLSENERTLYWTRYWYLKRGQEIPRHLKQQSALDAFYCTRYDSRLPMC